MRRRYLSLVLVVALAGLGAGCFKLGPRVVKDSAATQPTVATQQQTGQQKQTDGSTGQALQPGYQDTAVVGYLEMASDVKVDITRDGTKQAAQDSTELLDNDELQVTQGTAYIIYPDAGRARLDEGTDLVLLKDESADGNIFSQLRLNAGRVWTRFERLLGQDEYYSVSANGVVATVRGTAFGVAVKDDGVDIQVADHEVEVSNEAAVLVSANLEDANRIKLTAGQGIKIVTKGLLLPNVRILQSAVRQLSVGEKLDEAFKFGLTKLPLDKLMRPAQPVLLPLKPVVNQDLKLYRDLLLQRRIMSQGASSTFIAPDRAPLLQEIQPTTTPRVIGPSG